MSGPLDNLSAAVASAAIDAVADAAQQRDGVADWVTDAPIAGAAALRQVADSGVLDPEDSAVLRRIVEKMGD